MTQRLFHFVPEAAALGLRGDLFRPPSLATEGFVHLSFAHQLAGTLSVHFAGIPRVLLVELDPNGLADDLRLEPSRGGEDFPHLYRPLRRSDLLHGWWLSAGAEGLAPPDLDRPAPKDLQDFWPAP